MWRQDLTDHLGREAAAQRGNQHEHERRDDEVEASSRHDIPPSRSVSNMLRKQRVSIGDTVRNRCHAATEKESGSAIAAS
jgi:hypothetical protein